MAEVAEVFAQDWSLHQQGNTAIQTPNGIDTNDWENHTSCVLKTFPGPSEAAWKEFSSASSTPMISSKLLIQEFQWSRVYLAGDPKKLYANFT